MATITIAPVNAPQLWNPADSQPFWYAAYTSANHEKKAAAEIRAAEWKPFCLFIKQFAVGAIGGFISNFPYSPDTFSCDCLCLNAEEFSKCPE